MKFSGVQLLDSDSAGITMELEMQWDGNPNIVLDIQTTLGISLPVQVFNRNQHRERFIVPCSTQHDFCYSCICSPYIAVHFPCCKRSFLYIYHTCACIYYRPLASWNYKLHISNWCHSLKFFSNAHTTLALSTVSSRYLHITTPVHVYIST